VTRVVEMSFLRRQYFREDLQICIETNQIVTVQLRF